MKKKVKALLYSANVAMVSAMVNPNHIFAADIVGDVTGAINQVIATIRSIVLPITSLALIIIGVMMIMSDDAATKQKCKNWLISIAIGMALIVLAEPIATWLQGIAG